MRFRKRKKNDYSLMMIVFMGCCLNHLTNHSNMLIALMSKCCNKPETGLKFNLSLKATAIQVSRLLVVIKFFPCHISSKLVSVTSQILSKYCGKNNMRFCRSR